MTNSEFQEVIHRACRVAFDTGIKEGRKLEREKILKALDWKAEANKHGEYFYLTDLEDLLRELDNEETKVS
jgi:hypothetical protein